MSQLIQMQRRIKAIATTKKITQAMRLISISLHTRLKKYEENLNKYNSIISEIPNLDFISQYLDNAAEKNLYIIIGAQKGLCGTFNNQIAGFFNKLSTNQNDDVILIGKQIFNLIKAQNIIYKISNFSSQNLDTVLEELEKVISNQAPLKSIKIVYNKSKSFFYQLPQIIDIENSPNKKIDDKIWWWPEDKQELAEKYSKIYFKLLLRKSLLESLVAEQAARFRSMDNATTNAKKLLEEMKIKFNKTRQAKITKEITELSSNFQAKK
jgi:F-type H+-transporting ATPase subunit gamma